MKLYGELADWFHLLTHPDDYEEEARIFRETFEAHKRAPIRTMLELGCGGGNNASHLKAHYEMTLTDLSERMLEQSRKINPECEHIQGDMRTLRLDRTFDAVFVHDAIAYITTEGDLVATFETAAVHLERGGIALFVPDDTTESFSPHSDGGGHTDGKRSLSYEEETIPPSEGETSFRVVFTCTMRDGEDERVVRDTHDIGLFPRATWMRLLDDAGFDAVMLPFRHSEFPPDADKEFFVGIKR